MSTSISATPKADELIAQLQAQHGQLSFHYPGRIGSALSCLPKGELRIGSLDVLMGSFRDMPVYMLPEDADAWKDRAMVISVAPGHTRGFSLECGSGYHFVLKSTSVDDCGC